MRVRGEPRTGYRIYFRSSACCETLFDLAGAPEGRRRFTLGYDGVVEGSPFRVE